MDLSTVFHAASEITELIEIMKLNWLENRPQCAILIHPAGQGLKFIKFPAGTDIDNDFLLNK